MDSEQPAEPTAAEQPPPSAADAAPKTEPDPDRPSQDLLYRLGIVRAGPTTNEAVIINNTARRIGIGPANGCSDEPEHHGCLIIAPFGERQLPEEDLRHFDTAPWATRNLIDVRPPTEQRAQELERRQFEVTALARMWLLALLVLVGVQVDLFASSPWYWLGLVGVVGMVATSFTRVPAARAWASRTVSFWVILAIGIGLPAAGEWLVAGGRAVLDEPAVVLVARLVQLVFVSVAAVLPALLYYLFDRQQLGTLRQSFYRNVIELEPKILTIEDAKSAYGGMVAEVYGSEADTEGHGRFLASSRLPIIIATIVLTSGWLLVLPPLDHPELRSLLSPTPSAVSYGFLGAYFFSIGMIVRRYTRSDLKPKTYGHVTVRLLLTVVLVWALSALPLWTDVTDAAPGQPSPYLLALSFLVGIVPDTGLMVIRQFVSSTLLRARVESLHERLPLSQLDGVTLYEQARLAEEGIENVQNLVYFNLVELVLQTRIPLHRLIDWVDQGILVMHVGDPAQMEVLRARGLRNASDVHAAIAATRRRNGGKPGGAEECALVSLLDHEEPAGLHRLRTIHDALQNDEWFANIIRWRERLSLPGEHVFSLEQMFMSQRELLRTIGPANMDREANPVAASGLIGLALPEAAPSRNASV